MTPFLYCLSSALKYGGAGFAFAFSAIWFNWHMPGVQFVLCLCLYDGFLTLIDLNHSALLADLVTSEAGRAELSRGASIFSGCGTVVVFASFYLWDNTTMGPFQTFCVGCSVFTAIGYFFVTKSMR